MSRPLNVGVIGCGFMGRAHSNAYRKVNSFFDLEYRPVLRAICDVNPARFEGWQEKWGYESTETDWKRLLKRDDIELIDICVPNKFHKDIACAAAKAGKMVLCEKPLAMDAREGEAMTRAVEKAGVANMVWFNYRRVPAISLAKQIIDEGRLGRIFHYRALYLQDWTISAKVPQGGNALWRLDASVAGSGVTGDLLAHSIDTAMWLIGGVDSVCAMTETFIKERALQDRPEVVKPVRIDDACAFLARFRNGALATFESTRYARGRKNQNSFEVNGEKGSIYFNLEEPHRLQFFDHGDPPHLHGWRSILVTDAEHPYMKNWWVPGCTIGYEHTFINALADFLRGLETGKTTVPTFREALKTQYVCDAVLASAKQKKWVKVTKS